MPGAFLVHDLLTGEECDALVAHFAELGFAPKVSKRPGPPIRTSLRLLYEAHPHLLTQLNARLRPHLREDDIAAAGTQWKPDTQVLSDVWRVNHYEGEAQFFPHFDSGFAADESRRTLQSLVLYLNDCEGGETVFFPDGQRRSGMPAGLRDGWEVCVAPRKGSALIFAHFGPLSPRHSGRPTSTVKYIARTDLMYQKPPLSLTERLKSTSVRPLVLFLGPAASGKTTQAQLVGYELGFEVLGFGDLIRELRQTSSALGQRLLADAAVRDKVCKREPSGPRVPGGFLRDEVSYEVLTHGLGSLSTTGGVVVEGFPRSRSQSVMFETSAFDLWGVIYLEVSEGTRRTRLAQREREGDDPVSQSARDLDWEQVTAPLVHHYKKRGELLPIDGEGSPEEVTSRVVEVLRLRRRKALLDILPEEIKTRAALSGATPDTRRYTKRRGREVFRVGDVFLKYTLSKAPSEAFLQEVAACFAPLETPRWLSHYKEGEAEVLLTRAVLGENAKCVAQRCETDESRERLCATIAARMRALHDAPLPEHDSPNPSLPLRHPYRDAALRLQSGQVPLANFGQKYGVASPPQTQAGLQELWDALGPPPSFVPVCVHGDPCLPNWIIRDGEAVGVVDVGQAGLGPRGIDVAFAFWSFGHNLGARWAERFLDVYGRDCVPDLAYYTALIRFLA